MVGRQDLHPVPDLLRSAMVTSTTSRITQLKFRNTPAPRRMLKPSSQWNGARISGAVSDRSTAWPRSEPAAPTFRPNTVVNRHIGSKPNADRSIDVPVIGKAEPLFGKELDALSAAALIDRGMACSC
jgi:hypothetical protein